MTFRIYFTLLTLAILASTLSCTPEADVLPAPLEEQTVSAILSSNSIQSNEISLDPSRDCRELGQIVDAEKTNGCSLVIKLEDDKILYPVNIDIFSDELGLKEDAWIQFSFQRVELRTKECELGTPIKISDICRVQFREETPEQEQNGQFESRKN